MKTFQNHMRQLAQQAGQSNAAPRHGIVTSYDPNTYSVKVDLQPDGTPTGWLPVSSIWIGNGWGLFCPPSIGDAVEVQFQEDGIEAGYVCGRFFNDQDRPLNVPSGEFWLVHKSGSYQKLQNDGKFTINGQLEVDATAPTINLTAATAVNVTAPAINFGAAGQALKSLITDAFISLFNGHTHPVPGGTSSPPNQTASAAAHATSTVKGG